MLLNFRQILGHKHKVHDYQIFALAPQRPINKTVNFSDMYAGNNISDIRPDKVIFFPDLADIMVQAVVNQHFDTRGSCIRDCRLPC